MRANCWLDREETLVVEHVTGLCTGTILHGLPKIGAGYRLIMSANPPLAHLRLRLKRTFAGSTTVRAHFQQRPGIALPGLPHAECVAISAMISVLEGGGDAAQIARIRSRINARTSSENARTVPQSLASPGITL